MARKSDIAATLASVVVLTGVQGVAPALPEMRDAFGLDDAGVSLLTVGYLIAAAFIAAPVAALADRLGERRVLVSALVVFGLCGAVVTTAPNLVVLVCARTVQGATFGVVLAVTIGLTGKGLETLALARAQSTRVMAMSAAEVVLPVAAGALLGVSNWRFAVAMQLLAIPVAVICFFVLPGRAAQTASATKEKQGIGPAVAALRTPFGAAVQVPGFCRFLVKFTVLTYWPLLAVDAYGMSAWSVGLVLSVAAAVGIVAAWGTPVLIQKSSISAVTLVGMLVIAVPVAVLAAAPTTTVLVALVIVTGFGDGLLGVVNNVSASVAAPSNGRSAFFGLTGAIRNVGKFSALAVTGSAALVAPLGAAIAVVGVLALAASAVVPVIARGQPE